MYMMWCSTMSEISKFCPKTYDFFLINLDLYFYVIVNEKVVSEIETKEKWSEKTEKTGKEKRLFVIKLSSYLIASCSIVSINCIDAE